MRYLPPLVSFMTFTIYMPYALAQNGEPAITQLSFLFGDWDCNGTAYDFDTGASRPLDGRWAFKASCDNHWVVDSFIATDANQSYTAWGWTYNDPNGTDLLRDETDSMGNWSHAVAGGWADGMLVWRGSMRTFSDGTYQTETTNTNKADNRLWVAVVARLPARQRRFDVYKAMCRRTSRLRASPYKIAHPSMDVGAAS